MPGENLQNLAVKPAFVPYLYILHRWPDIVSPPSRVPYPKGNLPKGLAQENKKIKTIKVEAQNPSPTVPHKLVYKNLHISKIGVSRCYCTGQRCHTTSEPSMSVICTPFFLSNHLFLAERPKLLKSTLTMTKLPSVLFAST